MKAAFLRYRCMSIFFMTTISVLFFAYVVRIYERPYYNELGYLDFEHISSSIWATIITMSSVGYGGMYPSTSWGRAIIIISTLVGAFILSILIAILHDWIELEDNKKEALVTVTKRRKAVIVIKFAL